MSTVLVIIALSVSIKSFSYGLWEMKRQNVSGGGFMMLLSAGIIVLAIRYAAIYSS